MVVYFSAFIPFYTGICAPLFQLLHKELRWEWDPLQEHAFQEAKCSLVEAPLLGHLMQGMPYRLYTDTSDEALGCALQQVQPILVKDLKDTRAYERLQKAYDTGKQFRSLLLNFRLQQQAYPSRTNGALHLKTPWFTWKES